MKTSARLLLAAAVLLGACGGSGSSVTAPAAATPSPTPAGRRPSIVLVVADDMNIADLDHLPRLRQLVGEPGVSFDRHYATFGLCVPSRVSILTGKYPHNHGVYTNTPPDGGFPAFRDNGGERNTLATWFKAAGYRTGLLGKYLNSYPDGDPQYIPPGWDEWRAHLVTYGGDRYFNYWLNENRSVNYHGNAAEEYEADLMTRHAVEFIRQAAAQSQPFFLMLTPQAPHEPGIPAPRHAGTFRSLALPQPPSFNEADLSDKPARVQQRELLDANDIRRAQDYYRGRIESLLAVQDQVDQVLQTLGATGRLDDTYLVFTSDNGLNLGEHRLVYTKANNYEETIHMPLSIRTPRGTTRRVPHPVVNADIAPTLLELAGLPVPEGLDGRSLVPLLAEAAPAVSAWPRDVLVESYAAAGTFDSGLRTPEYLYNELESGERELYDMRSDPWQVQSLHRTAGDDLLRDLASRLQPLRRCRGQNCRR